MTSLLLFFVSMYVMARLFVLWLTKRKWPFPARTNYKSASVPSGYGIVFAWYCFIGIIFMTFSSFYVLVSKKLPLTIRDFIGYDSFTFYVLPVIVMLVGYYDDIKGNKDVKGLKKNLKLFLTTGRLTSSLAKAMIVFCCAVIFAFVSSNSDSFYNHGKPSLFGHVMNVLLLSLMTNFFNLLDLRPGRAIKGFLLLFVLLLILSYQQKDFVLLLVGLYGLFPILAAVLAYAPLDFRGQAMMGDAGSNMLGFVLGIGYAVILPLPAKIAVVILLTLFHIYCEFYSFSDFISRNRVLRYLDEFGTCMRENKK